MLAATPHESTWIRLISPPQWNTRKIWLYRASVKSGLMLWVYPAVVTKPNSYVQPSVFEYARR